MKKFISLLLALVLIFSLAACTSTKNETAPEKEETTETPETEVQPEETPETEENTDDQPAAMPEEPADDQPAEMPELPAEGEGESVMPEANPEVDELMGLLDQLTANINSEMMVMNAEVTSDMYEYQLFIPYVEGSIAVTSAPMIGSIAHSVVLVKLAEGTDVAAVAADIEANMNPRKWVCVEAESSYVKTSGQYVLLVMSTADMADAIAANFVTVFGA